jgi:hypothetical protein
MHTASCKHQVHTRHPLLAAHLLPTSTPLCIQHNRCPFHLCASAAGLVGLIGYAAANNPAADMAGGEAAAAESAEAPAPAPLPRKNAVLVFGASGKLGRKIVERVSGGVVECDVCWLVGIVAAVHLRGCSSRTRL